MNEPFLLTLPRKPISFSSVTLGICQVQETGNWKQRRMIRRSRMKASWVLDGEKTCVISIGESTDTPMNRKKLRQNNRSIWVLLVFVLCFIGVKQICGQGTATINGTLVDTSGAAIANGKLVLTNVDTGQPRTTNSTADGLFVFSDLPVGHFELRAQGRGFKTWTQSAITLTVGQQLTLYPKLQVGQAETSVEVTTAPPQVTTSEGSLSQVVEHKQITDLPLNGRNALQLMALAPGVISTGTAGQFGATQVVFASSGGRDIDVYYSLDGAYNENPFYEIAGPYPNPDGLEEFAVGSREYSARNGRGSTNVSAATRSGTNSVHGSAWEFIRNTNFDARPYFSLTIPAYHRNQFGGTVGGPIVRNKLHYFLSYQGTQQSGGPGNQTYTTVPIPERTGDFSGVATPIIDPLTGLQFPGNIIPANRITPQATKFFTQYLPAPNLGPSTYTFPNVGTLQQHQGLAKIDYQLSSNDNVFARYLIDDSPQVAYGSGSGSALGTNWLSNEPTRFQNITVGWVHTFTPSLLNDVHLAYIRSAFSLLPDIQFSLSALGYGVSSGNAFSDYGLTPDSSLTLSGVFGAYPGAPARDIMPTTQISDNLAWVKGRHTFNIGAEIFRNRLNELANFYTDGAFTFSGQFTGAAAADFLIGDYANFSQEGGLASRLHQVLPSAYLQDDIKLTKRLTTNLGVRWDLVSGYSSEQNQLSVFDPGVQSTVFPLATPGLLYPGDKGVPKNAVGTRWNNIAPRVGLAWDITGNGRSSLRAGFGIFYVPLTRGITLNRLTQIQPFTTYVSISGGNAEAIFAGPPFNGVNPFPRPTGNDYNQLKLVPFVPQASESSLQPNMKTEASQEWSLSLQQAIGARNVIEVDYVGSATSHLTASINSNPAQYVPGNSTISNTQSRRLYPTIGPVNTIADSLSANYNGLQVVFNSSHWHGLDLKSSYTWSRSLGVVGCEFEGCNGPRDPNDYHLDYGPLPFDVNQNWVTSLLWQPHANSSYRSKFLEYTVGGWQIGGIATVQSGTPLNLLSGFDNSFTGNGEDTPDVVGGWGSWKLSESRPTASKVAEWFNPQAFKQNAIGTFGQLSENALRNPGYTNVDCDLQKRLILHEGYQLELRAAFYNVLNHTTLGSPVSTLTSPNFGQIQSSGTPRIMEFGTRFTF
jgi:hypothetical protein